MTTVRRDGIPVLEIGPDIQETTAAKADIQRIRAWTWMRPHRDRIAELAGASLPWHSF
jgi:hypothetical protein